LQYQLKQAQAKIFKPRVKPKSKEGQPKRGAPVGHRVVVVGKGQRKSLGMLMFIPKGVISVVGR